MVKETPFTLSSKNIYLQRYAWPSIDLHKQITGSPEIIIVIPAHKEVSITHALQALNKCSLPIYEVAILIIVNESEIAENEVSSINQSCLDTIRSFQSQYQIVYSYQKLPVKKAGVGLARKIGMDEAVRHFESLKKDGIIVCYDADCQSEPNYLSEIKKYYQSSESKVGIVHYEHKLNGTNQVAITNYELHLRYYVNALRYANYPNALQTLGSCITVRSSAYQKQGGMNTRKAGEDFYFIHKMVPLGGIGEINSTTVYPSDRVSDRVPFGTGHAIDKYLSNPDTGYPTYSPRIFDDLRFINLQLDEWYANHSLQLNNSPESLKGFFKETGFVNDLEQLIDQSGSFENFVDRYYQWWDGLRVLKFVHYARDHFYPNIDLDKTLSWLLSILKLDHFEKSRGEILSQLRAFDKAQKFYIK